MGQTQEAGHTHTRAHTRAHTHLPPQDQAPAVGEMGSGRDGQWERWGRGGREAAILQLSPATTHEGEGFTSPVTAVKALEGIHQPQLRVRERPQLLKGSKIHLLLLFFPLRGRES